MFLVDVFTADGSTKLKDIPAAAFDAFQHGSEALVQREKFPIYHQHTAQQCGRYGRFDAKTSCSRPIQVQHGSGVEAKHNSMSSALHVNYRTNISFSSFDGELGPRGGDEWRGKDLLVIMLLVWVIVQTKMEE